MEHAEDFSSQGSQEEQYYAAYEDLGVHKVMLSDRPRMDFYRRILTDPAVVQGKIIVDVGSGSGILSAWAAMGGAAHVFSVEASSLAHVQPLLFQENDLADRISVLHTTVESLVEIGAEAFVAAHGPLLLGGVAVIVSEWMGFYLLHEAMLPSVLAARDFFAAVNRLLGAPASIELVPSSARLLAAPITLAPLYATCYRPFWGCIDGVRMETLGRMAFHAAVDGPSPLIEVMPGSSLLVKPDAVAVLWERNLLDVEANDLVRLDATARFRLSAAATATTDSGDEELAVDGFTLWFEVRHGEAILDTAPTAPPTHWKQTTILLPQEVREERLVSLSAVGSDTLDVSFTLRASEPGSRSYVLEFELC